MTYLLIAQPKRRADNAAGAKHSRDTIIR